MTTPFLESNEALDWVRVFDTTLTAQPFTEGREGSFHPMAAYTIPFIFSRHVLTINAVSANAKEHWSLAFYLEMLIDVAAIGLSKAESFKVNLGLNLIRLPNINGIFQLRIRYPKWHKDMSMTFWQYVGTEADLLDTASPSILILRDINRKLNDIDVWGNP